MSQLPKDPTPSKTIPGSSSKTEKSKGTELSDDTATKFPQTFYLTARKRPFANAMLDNALNDFETMSGHRMEFDVRDQLLKLLVDLFISDRLSETIMARNLCAAIARKRKGRKQEFESLYEVEAMLQQRANEMLHEVYRTSRAPQGDAVTPENPEDGKGQSSRR